jgi:hypothetical protein
MRTVSDAADYSDVDVNSSVMGPFCDALRQGER